MEKFNSRKRYEGFSTVFRQWKAVDTHCSKLHGYAVYFDITFEGDLDHRSWVADFGILKRAKTQIDGMNAKVWMDYMFDHTTVLAPDDPELELFRELDKKGVIQLRVLEGPVGAERFAEYIYNKVNRFIQEETEGRVKVVRVEFFENSKNSAIYSNL
jgi:6-pyruvoyltetrahydropterin/6-carboxytetrahydropterin synthase